MAHELVNRYGRKSISPRSILKIDMQKAYDSLEWPYLKHILRMIGFQEIFVVWIVESITSVTYFIIIDGKIIKPFAARKGLRQSDPHSPFLFVLGMEYLSRLLNSLMTALGFKYHPRCAKLNVVQLGFANVSFCLVKEISNQLNPCMTSFRCFTKPND